MKSFGKDAAKAVWDSGAAAIDQIVNNIRAEDIACDFHWVPGYLHAPFENATDKDRELLRREAEVARELEIESELLPAIPYGSRFKPGGEVLSGPAEEPLEKLPLPRETE